MLYLINIDHSLFTIDIFTSFVYSKARSIDYIIQRERFADIYPPKQQDEAII